MGKLSINLKALAGNYARIQREIGANCIAGAAVKADSYGLGMEPVSQALYSAGCRDFFVATLQEGIKLRAALPDVSIACLNGLAIGQEADYAAHNLTPILGSLDEITRWQTLAQEHGKQLPAILHIDTGMNRHGLPDNELSKLYDAPDYLSGLNVTTVMSHFACADELSHPMNHAQYQKFMNAMTHFRVITPRAKFSLCNSSGIFRSADYHLDLVRPGMALYGLNPTPETANPMQAVVSLSVPIIQIKTVEKQSAAGYNATYCFDKYETLAIVPLGYADGFHRSLSNNGALYYNGVRCPVRGRVSMDLTIIDISAIPESDAPRVGDMMQVIGADQSADDLARAAGTIGYEILTSLGARYDRNYVS